MRVDKSNYALYLQTISINMNVADVNFGSNNNYANFDLYR